ncbi:cell wall hydrolase [Sphingomonas sp.]|jgi:spore germination cell wall hydrolase CwlJ-like protein|uniref:cell wall hydrolase n=1 Tax=Sphingomonas sp. TaxID=28214 RepID=UPI002605AC89|nr:cell wall hydrolase [Sphingomonas sp.]MDF2493951.1 cell wall hydrolase [Sphingomonas sp.]
MSFLSRAALAAAMTITFFGLTAQSTAGLAAEVEHLLPQPTATAATPTVFTPTPVKLSDPTDLATDELASDETVAYPSLAAAVAAQSTHDGDDEALQCLAGAIYFETRGEPLSGQLAVAEVILNRAKSGRFPSDVCEVITQRGQFGFVRGGRIPNINEDSKSYRTAVAVAKVALNDAWDDQAGPALYFNRGRAPASGLKKVASIGNHIFWR